MWLARVRSTIECAIRPVLPPNEYVVSVQNPPVQWSIRRGNTHQSLVKSNNSDWTHRGIDWLMALFRLTNRHGERIVHTSHLRTNVKWHHTARPYLIAHVRSSQQSARIIQYLTEVCVVMQSPMPIIIITVTLHLTAVEMITVRWRYRTLLSDECSLLKWNKNIPVLLDDSRQHIIHIHLCTANPFASMLLTYLLRLLVPEA